MNLEGYSKARVFRNVRLANVLRALKVIDGNKIADVFEVPQHIRLVGARMGAKGVFQMGKNVAKGRAKDSDKEELTVQILPETPNAIFPSEHMFQWESGPQSSSANVHAPPVSSE